MLEKQIKKWKEKKLKDKIGDLLFALFLIAMLIPQSRMTITVAVKRVFAFSPRAIASEKRAFAETGDFFWPMETLDGEEINLTKFQGKTLFLNEWATWCPPCVAEMPSIQKLYDLLKEDDTIAFIIVSNESRETVEAFMRDEGYTFPVMLTRSAPPDLFYSKSIPTTFLVAPSGEVVLKEVGSKKWHGQETVDLIRSLR